MSMQGKLRMVGAWAVVAVLGSISLTACSGEDDSCTPVKSAMTRADEQPGMRQLTEVKTTGQPTESLEMIVLVDAVYMRMGTTWQKQPLTANDRRKVAADIMASTPPKGCAVAGQDTIGGQSATIYTYNQTDSLNGGKQLSVKLWVVDGLPRRMEADNGTTQTMEYGRFDAPLM